MERSRPTVALTIAGSDPCGGAGIQGDLKTFSALEVFGAAAVTAVTVQDTRGVRAVHPLEPAWVAAQIDAVLGDLPVDAIKVGMLATAAVAAVVAERLRAAERPVVLDPVLAASGGERLLAEDGLAVLRAELLPLADVLTPNLAEAAALLGLAEGEVLSAPETAVRALRDLGPRAVVLKGGHAGGAYSEDLYFDGVELARLPARRIPSRNTHGTGCAFSSAVAAYLARGDARLEAARRAKAFVTGAIEGAREWTLGQGTGPLHHLHPWWGAQP
jgi:hydroxymethylpyrimidine/phosphomethylpyrimidine kinase